MALCATMLAMPAAPLSNDDTRRLALLKEFGIGDPPASASANTLIDCALQLHAQRERLSDFARASGDWMWETDAHLSFTWLSDTFSAATGLAPESLLGRCLADSPLFDGDGRIDSASGFRALLMRHAAFSRAVSPMQTPGGVLKVSHSAVPVFDGERRFAGFRGTARDVTAQLDAEYRVRAQALLLRRSEERWEMAAAATGIGIAEVDLATGRMQLDARACVNHGLAHPARGYTLADWIEAIHPDDRAQAQAALRDAIEECGRFESRIRFRRADSSVCTIEVVANAAPGADGRATGIVGTCRDVTQQVVHEQLLRDQESAVRANRAKSQFLSRVSHELRTPLNGILGFAQLMVLDRVHPLAPDQQRRLDSVHRAGRHLLGLINDVLDLSRIEHEDFSLHLEPVDLCAALDASLSLIAPLARESRVALPATPPTPCWVRADRRALEQVLMNLLSNAIKYNRNSGRVGIALRTEGDRVTLAISDEGAGLTDAQQARLFQHFDRLGAETSRVEGTGLGLVICQELAHAMGAELRVQSQTGAGSTFTVSLPAAPAPQVDAGVAAASSEPQGSAVEPRRKVLYIEDERLNVVLMEEVFRTRPQWSLSIAEDGAKGLRMARDERPHLVLIDMNLPDMSGLTLIRTLRSDPATLPLRCIALSADAMSEQIETALAAGFDEYWTKPIDVQRMLADLARRLN